MGNLTRIVNLKRSVYENLLLEVLQKFPLAVELKERVALQRQMIRAINVLCPDVMPAKIDSVIRGKRFAKGLQERVTDAQLGFFAQHGYFDESVSPQSLQDIEHFKAHGRWQADWQRAEELSLYEVEQACSTLVMLDSRTTHEKEYFAEHGIWLGTSDTSLIAAPATIN